MKLLKIDDKYVRTDRGLVLAPTSEHDGTPIGAISEEEFLALIVESNIGKIVSYNGDDYRIVNVNGNVEAVMLSDAPTLIEKTITENGTYSASEDGADGYNLVNVNIASENKLAMLLGVQDATNNPYEITASDLEGVTEIGDYAFSRKNGMVSIDLTNITSIGNYAFEKCEGLEEININRIEDLNGKKAQFYMCYGIKRVYAEKLKTIPERFLESCPLEEFYCPEVTRIEGAYSMGGTSSKRSFAGKDLVFPKVTYVSQSAFDYCGARKMSFPALVKDLGTFTFYQNPNLEEIDLPLLETAPTTYFVYQCPKVTKLVLPKLQLLDFGGIYYNNKGLTLIDLPSATSLTCSRYQFSSGTPNIRLKLGYDGVVALNKASNAVFPNAITEVYVKPNYVEEYKIATNWVDWIAQGTVTIKSLDEFVE